MRYPFAPVEAQRGDLSFQAFAERVGVTRETIYRWRRDGLSEENADRCASAVGMVAYNLWPEMLEAAVAEVQSACETCGDQFIVSASHHRFCSDRCRQSSPSSRQRRAARMRAERAAETPEQREKRLAAARQYKDDARRAVLAGKKRHYQENADRLREQRKARYWAAKNEVAA